MKGTLLVDYIASPRSVSLRDLKVGARGTGTFELQRSDNSTAKIESVVIDDTKNFTIRRIEGEAEGNSTYEVMFRGRKEVGTTSTKVRVVTSGESTPTLVVPVNASAAMNLRYLRSLRFTRKDGKLRDRVIHISARHGDAPKIKKVEDPDGLLELEIQDAQGVMANISAKVIQSKWEALVDDAARHGPHKLIVFTNDRDEPRIEFQYRVSPESKNGGPKLQARPIPAVAH